jgi:hypothetical protein
MINPLNILAILEEGMMSLNNSKFFAGAMMLLMNLGARNIAMELSEMHEKILNHKFVRRLLVFVLVFYATRDVKVSIIITIVFIILVSGIFHEDSEFCILPTKNVNKNRKITKEEFMVAQEIVGKYQKQSAEAAFSTIPTPSSNNTQYNDKINQEQHLPSPNNDVNVADDINDSNSVNGADEHHIEDYESQQQMQQTL